LNFAGNLNWRIATPDGGFFTRSAVQNFVQDENQPGILINHGNEFLHYQDDWSVLFHYVPKSSPLHFLNSGAFSISLIRMLIRMHALAFEAFLRSLSKRC
jgi:hypothetical protein